MNALFLEENHYNWLPFLLFTGLSGLYGIVMWEATMQWLLFTRRRYADIRQTSRRFWMTFMGYLLITSSMQALFLSGIDLLGVNTIPMTTAVYLTVICFGFVFVMLVGGLFEFMYYLQKYREAIEESEAIKKASLQNQYDNLRNQVNPHFLFNSLNSLAALIGEDREKAGIFLEELSSMYRYLLQAGQRPLVTLEEEVAFLHAYRYLLDTRFGKAIRWEIAIDDPYLAYWLPPLTLQTLIENALRHNSLLADQPLNLHISTRAGGTLVVRNDLHRKKAPILAPQGGLTILAMHYESLGLPTPVIQDDGALFSVQLPLTREEAVESILKSQEAWS